MTPLAAQTPKGPRPASIDTIRKLLTEFGYVPGALPGVWDTDTNEALWLYLGIENRRALLDDSSKSEVERYEDIIRFMQVQKQERDKGPKLFVPLGGGINSYDTFFDRSGRFLVSNNKGLVRIWDAATGRQVRAMQLPEIVQPKFDNSFDITADGRFLVTVQHAFRVLDIETGKAVRTFWTRITGNRHATIFNMALRPGSSEIIVGENSEVVIYDWAAGRFVASLGKYGNVRFRDGNVVRWYRYEAAKSIAVSPDGRYAATGGTEFGIRIYDLNSRTLVFTASAGPGVAFQGLRFSGDGRAVFAEEDRLSGTATQRRLYRLDMSSRSLRQLPFESVSTIRPASQGVYIWGERTKSEFGLYFVESTTGSIRKLSDPPPDAVSPDGVVTAKNGSGRPGDAPSDAVVFSRRDGGSLVFRQRPVVTAQFLGSVRISDSEDLARTVWTFSTEAGNVERHETLAGTESVNTIGGTLERSSDGRTLFMLGGPYKDTGEQPSAALARQLFDFRAFEPGSGALRCVGSERSTWWSRDLFGKDRAPERGKDGSFGWSAQLGLAYIWTASGVAVVDQQSCRTLRRIAVQRATGYVWRVWPGLFKINVFAKPQYSSGLAVSGDGQKIFAWRQEPAVQSFDPRTGQRLKVYKTAVDIGRPTTIPAEDIRFVTSNPQHTLVRRILAIPGTDQFLVHLDGGVSVGDTNSVGFILLFKEDDELWQFSFMEGDFQEWAVSAGGARLALLSSLGTVKIVDPRTGHLVVVLKGDEPATSIRFAPGGRLLLVQGRDGYLRTYDSMTGELVLSTLVFSDGEWLSLTPEGFFSASDRGAEAVVIRLQGLETTPVGRAYQSLYRPDLVREKLAGDPQGKVKEAAARLDLGKVIASGGAPRLTIEAPAGRAKADTDEIAVEVAIADQGGGVGRVEWRVNGVTLGLDERGLTRVEGAAAPTQIVRRTLSLEPGENKIEVVAYNAKKLIASEPVSVTVTWDGERSVTPPKLHVLAVGVNDYWDSRLKLNYAVPDAKALAAGLTKAGASLYGESGVKVTTLADAEVTVANLDKAFAQIGKEVHPRDTFALFVAGHGKTLNGRYYFLPHDFRYAGEESIENAGIDQDRLQAWLAQIRARKTVVLFDTCESGSLTGDRLAVRGLERVAAFEKLTRAIGRTVLSASGDDAPALEGYKGHGAFTYVLLEALGAGDINGNGLIEVGEIADYLESKLPDLTFQAFKLRQVPHRKMVGNNFALVGKATVLPTAVAPSTPAASRPTHVVTAVTAVREAASGTAAVVAELSPGMQVTLMETSGGWALVAREGKQLGYVEDKALARLH